MIEQIKLEHESLRQPTTTHPSITRYYEILNNEETSKLDGSNSNNGINKGINKTIEDMHKVIYSQNNIDGEISKQISILYSMVKELERRVFQLPISTTPRPTAESNKNTIEEIGIIKQDLKTIKENAARDKLNTYQTLDHLNDMVVELRNTRPQKVRESSLIQVYLQFK